MLVAVYTVSVLHALLNSDRFCISAPSVLYSYYVAVYTVQFSALLSDRLIVIDFVFSVPSVG